MPPNSAVRGLRLQCGKSLSLNNARKGSTPIGKGLRLPPWSDVIQSRQQVPTWRTAWWSSSFVGANEAAKESSWLGEQFRWVANLNVSRRPLTSFASAGLWKAWNKSEFQTGGKVGIPTSLGIPTLEPLAKRAAVVAGRTGGFLKKRVTTIYVDSRKRVAGSDNNFEVDLGESLHLQSEAVYKIRLADSFLSTHRGPTQQGLYGRPRLRRQPADSERP